MMENALKVSHISLVNARQCLERGNYGRAFANFLLFLKLEPARCAEVYLELLVTRELERGDRIEDLFIVFNCYNRKKNVYLEFSLVTREWCEELERGDRIEDLFNCYDQACELYPNHDTVLNNIGAQLFRLGYVEEAAAYIRRSLLVNPNYLAAHDNLENICSHLVERWHFAMLNDKRRNVAYKFAIEKAVKSGYDTVLDIGTGTGILSLMSESCGARAVTACDSSRAMVEVARDVLAANRASQRVNLIHKSSTELAVPQDIPNKVKLVVTEIFDAGLFGEHAISTLIHAWRNLISTSPMGTIIPCGATMYVCGIECESIRRQNRLLYPVLQYVDLSQVDVCSNTGQVAEEPYTTENLAKVPGGYKILTNISELLRVNFCNLFELESLNNGKDWTCDLYVKQRGSVDALAVWFDLLLDDSVTIATGADNRSCWEQAIYPVTNLLRKKDGGHESSMARKKETLRSVFHFEQDCLRLVNCEIVEHKKQPDLSDLTVSDKCGCHSSTIKRVTLNTSNELTLPFRKRKVEPSLCGLSSSGVDPSVSCSVGGDKHLHTETACREDVCDSLQSVTIATDDGVSGVTIATDDSVSGVTIATDEGVSRLAIATGDGISKVATEASDSVQQSISIAATDNTQNVSMATRTDCVLSAMSTEADCSCPVAIEAKLVNDNSKVSDETFELSFTNSAPLSRVETSTCTQLKHELVVSSDTQCGDVSSVISETVVCECADVGSESVIVEEVCYTVDSCANSDLVPHFEGGKKSQTEPSRTSVKSDERIVCLADPAEIEYVNDIYLNKQYIEMLERYCRQHPSKKPSLLYLSQRLSFVAIQACKIGFDVVVMVTPEEHHSTITQVAELNGCDRDSLVLIDTASVNSVQIGVDVILCDVVEPYGALGQHALENITFQRMTSLNPGGLVLPCEMRIYGVYVESEELENLNHVTDNSRTLDFIVAEYINVFQMQNHVNIDLPTLSYNKLSEVFELLKLDLSDTTGATDAGNLLDQRVEKTVPVVTGGKISALVYWFELKLADDLVVHTVDPRCHWKQAAIMMKEKVAVTTGQNLVTVVTLQNSCLGIKPVAPLSQNGGTSSCTRHPRY